MLVESVMIRDPATERAVQSAPEAQHSGSAVSWGAIIAGAIAAAALSLVLLAFGAGLGFSVVSPWSAGAPSMLFKVSTGIYFIVIAMLASSVGGYLAGRLRTRWVGTHSREVFFRDTAHGFLTWCFATLLSASVLASAAGGLVASSGAVTITHPTGQTAGLLDGYVDSLMRPTHLANVPNAETPVERTEVARILAAAVASGSEVNAADQSYLVSLVEARTGLSQTQAEERTAAVIADAKVAADKARKAAAQLSLWLTASLLVGAFSASLAAIEGGGLRDGTWKYSV